jgi:hypothetical protein
MRMELLAGYALRDHRPFVSDFIVQLHQSKLLLCSPLGLGCFLIDVVLVSTSSQNYRSRHCLALFRGRQCSLAMRLATRLQFWMPSSSYSRRNNWSYYSDQTFFSFEIIYTQYHSTPKTFKYPNPTPFIFNTSIIKLIETIFGGRW